jgi:hypothetical protein
VVWCGVGGGGGGTNGKSAKRERKFRANDDRKWGTVQNWAHKARKGLGSEV